VSTIWRSAGAWSRLPSLLVAVGVVVAAVASPVPARGSPSLAESLTTIVSAANGDPVIAAAGDIACDPAEPSFNGGQGTSGSCHQRATSDLMVGAGLAAVLPLGDNQYYCGSYGAFVGSYDLSWGRLKTVTYPAVGNHEYLTHGGSKPSTGCDASNAGAAGYFRYFGGAAGDPAKGYYSFDIGAWHLVALNTQCSAAGGCSTSSPQGKWLAADLDAHPNQCTLAYFHIPLFSSGGRASSNSTSLWQILYGHHADLVLNGHDHIYERFAPQTPTGVADQANGIREFIVGTGGANLTSMASIAANSVVHDNKTYGVLAMTLHPSSYDWQFVPEAGKTFSDSGTAPCHQSGGAPAPTPTPTATPTAGPTATSTASPSGAPTPTPTAAPTPSEVLTLAPVADSYVDTSNPNANYGKSTSLRFDGSPIVRSYLAFSLAGVPGTIIRATLRVYANTASSAGYTVGGVSGSWTETGITAANAPPVGPTIGSSGAFGADTWTSVDVTALLAGGQLSLALSGINVTAVRLSSRESGSATAPQLVLEIAP
jgi:hypothetical protein